MAKLAQDSLVAILKGEWARKLCALTRMGPLNIYGIGGSFIHLFTTNIVHLPFIRNFAIGLQLTGLKNLVNYDPCLQGLVGELENLMCPDMKFVMFFPPSVS